jgi:hypothetical protein
MGLVWVFHPRVLAPDSETAAVRLMHKTLFAAVQEPPPALFVNVVALLQPEREASVPRFIFCPVGPVQVPTAVVHAWNCIDWTLPAVGRVKPYV